MATPAIVQDEQHQRLEVKLRRELGDQILRLLDDSLTEDILLNPDGSLWVKQMGQGFSRIGEMPAAQAASALGTIAAWRGTVLNHERPILETELPIDGSRFEGHRRRRLSGGPCSQFACVLARSSVLMTTKRTEF